MEPLQRLCNVGARLCYAGIQCENDRAKGLAMESGKSVTTIERQSESLPRAALREWIVVATAVIALAADQISKYLVRENMAIGESWPAQGFFRLTHGTNTGSAFGLFQDQTVILTIASVFAIGFIIYFYRSHSDRAWITKLTIGLLLGGAVGNLIDRVIAGRVTDFIDVGPWPIFNLADSSITVGITLLIASLVLTGGRTEDPPTPEGGESTDSDER